MVCAGLAVGGLITQASTGALAHTLRVTDDAYIQSDNADRNKGSDKKVKLKDDGSGGDRIGFVKVDLSTLPNYVVPEDIVKATFRVWIENVSDEGTITLQQPGGPWDEEDITADNAPSIGPPTIFTANVTEDDEQSFVLINVTPIVRAWVGRRIRNDGIALVPGGGLKAEVAAKETEHERSMDIEVELHAVVPEVTSVPLLRR
jgi:hypothetical protein